MDRLGDDLLARPVSPSISTETRARAALAATASAARKPGAEPTISSKPSGLPIFSDSGRSSPDLRRRSVAASRAASSRSGASGLTRKSLAPARIASTATATLVWAVRTRRGSSGFSSRSWRISPVPSSPGSQWSSRMASNFGSCGSVSIFCAASRSDAPRTHQPARAPMAVIRRRCAGSSSINSRQRVGSGRICFLVLKRDRPYRIWVKVGLKARPNSGFRLERCFGVQRARRRFSRSSARLMPRDRIPSRSRAGVSAGARRGAGG